MAEFTSYPADTPSWVDLATPDIDASKAFYGSLFGWTALVGPPEAGGYTMFQKGGKNVAGAMSITMEGQPPAWMTYVNVDDADATVDRVKKAGGMVFVEPMDVLDVGRMAVFADTTGAAISVWQPKKHAGADLANEPGAFCWNELQTRDTEAAKAFYADVMAWNARDVSMPGMAYALFSIGESSVGGLVNLPEHARGATPRWLGYVGVDDVEAVVARVHQLGGAVHIPPTDIPNIGRFSIVADPQMATLALLEPLLSAQALHIEQDTPGRVGWHELLAGDRNKALAFYGALFGWQEVEDNVGARGMYPLFSVGGQTIGGIVSKAKTAPVPLWLYYFNVGDIDAAVKRVKAAGGQIYNGPVEVPNGWIVHCTDPQGAVFALVGKRSYKAMIFLEPPASGEAFSWRKRSAD